MAEPGGIRLSQQVHDQVRTRLTTGFEFLGDRRPHSFEHDMAVYRVTEGASPRSREPRRPGEARTGAGSARRHIIFAARRNALRFVGLYFVINIATGGRLFSHWTALPALGVIGHAGVPRLFREPRERRIGRLLVASAILLAMNLFTWSGTLWAIYPIAAMTAV